MFVASTLAVAPDFHNSVGDAAGPAAWKRKFLTLIWFMD